MEMQAEMLKAQVLIEALPYIRKFYNKKVVVKYGGSAMLDPELQLNVIRDVALLKLVGMKPVIVHGGGKEISKWVAMLGKEPQFVEGLRVTDAETMEVAEMVLNKVNKNLVQMLEQIGVKAAGICGKDGATLHVTKKTVNGQDIGFAMPVIFSSEDGKCFIMEFCVYPEFRGNGTGKECAAVLLDWARENGALYAELN